MEPAVDSDILGHTHVSGWDKQADVKQYGVVGPAAKWKMLASSGGL